MIVIGFRRFEAVLVDVHPGKIREDEAMSTTKNVSNIYSTWNHHLVRIMNIRHRYKPWDGAIDTQCTKPHVDQCQLVRGLGLFRAYDNLPSYKPWHKDPVIKQPGFNGKATFLFVFLRSYWWFGGQYITPKRVYNVYINPCQTLLMESDRVFTWLMCLLFLFVHPARKIPPRKFCRNKWITFWAVAGPNGKK